MRYFVLFLLLLSSYRSHAFDPNALHPFTDLDGRTLEAKFIGTKGDSITIEWNGKTFDLPLASLNAETRALAGLLSGPNPHRRVTGRFVTGRTRREEPSKPNLWKPMNVP